jgi:hypothetical protein
LICDPIKLSVTSYFNNVKPTKHMHLVYLVHHDPNFTHFMIDQVSDCGEANLPAVCYKEDMTIDKENINAYANLLLELKYLFRDYHQTLRLALTSLSYSIAFKSRNRTSTNLVGNLGIINCNGTTANATNLEHSLEVSI